MLRVHESLLRSVIIPHCISLDCPADPRDIVWIRLRLDCIVPKIAFNLSWPKRERYNNLL